MLDYLFIHLSVRPSPKPVHPFQDWLSTAYAALRRIESLTLETVKDEERTVNEPLTFTSNYIRLLDDPEVMLYSY